MDLTKIDRRALPCPFCGSKLVLNWNSHDAGPDVWCVFCQECEAEGPHSLGENQAVLLWNSRIPAVAEEE